MRADGPAVMITDHVPAVRLPPDHAGDHVAAAVAARGGVEDRRDFASASPSHRPAASSGAPPEAELGGPGPARDPVRRDTESASPGAAAGGHPGHDPALAPRHRRAPLGGAVHAGQVRPPGDPQEHQGSGPPAGPGEPRMGVPQDPRGAGRPGSQSRGVDRMGDPQDQRHRPRAATDRADLVAVPAFSGRSDPGVRLLHVRPARRHPGLRPGRDRARGPGASASSASRRIPPRSGPPSRPATCSWTSASKRSGSSS